MSKIIDFSKKSKELKKKKKSTPVLSHCADIVTTAMEKGEDCAIAVASEYMHEHFEEIFNEFVNSEEFASLKVYPTDSASHLSVVI